MGRILLTTMMMLSFTFTAQAWGAHFVQPKWNGYALDWCKNFEGLCGLPAADAFCQKKGYPKSTAFQIEPAVSFQTMTIGQNAICNPSVHRCDSFAYIDCQETTKTFNNPSYNGYRLDWCAQFENNCGATAANEFCQKAGFIDAVGFGFQPQLTVPTMSVGDNAICNPAFHRCDSFAFITCKK